MRFEWHSAKAESNKCKHGIDFSAAARVFADPHALTEYAGIEAGEHRWQTIGKVAGRAISLLVVIHADRSDSETEVIRIISTRRANRKEQRRYEQACPL